ncbi:hypothetical protein NUU61_000399 [Penicillium alfredii]|uniref:Transcription factor Rba50 n=1 Tax=Penicillium alfredii TaxID=1506179 RepID=A0A9W9G9H5_9EURO|nr:uncharacterized protein NUU61_000399 [Penicillium alfredii]KAJ5114640.1 hypothetical protein NUU61_000399 [Penicillium alfredii]
MAFRGERFVLDLDEPSGPSEEQISSPFSLIGEIQERTPSATLSAPKPPTPSASTTGFPPHRRRNKPSSFKQRRANQSAPADPSPASPAQDDKKTIDEENRRQLASMSDAQIEQEREELMAAMDPGLLQSFLRRARIDEDETISGKEPPAPTSKEPSKPKKSVSFDIPESSVSGSTSKTKPTQIQPQISEKQPASGKDDLAPTEPPQDLHPASERPSLDPALLEAFHFPQPKQSMPTLDPSSPSFLSDLQSHYFPEIAHDPAALSWLQPPSTDPEDPDSTSAYHPASSAISVAPSAIRFSLRGTILAPSTSLSLPTTLGLHHHGDDPQAAGYTIPELAILSRSSFPAQRCIAWQVMGRILFRLGRAEFGDRGGQLSEGLWYVIEKEGVVATMLAEADGSAGQSLGTNQTPAPENEGAGADAGSTAPAASGIGRHASAAAWAVEGVWLWQKGGGGDRGLLKENQIRSQ